MTSKAVDEQSFAQDVIARSHELPVVVDFWAAWCGPCQMLAPALERAVDERAGTVELVKVDVDANQTLAAAHDVRGIPAVKAFRRGRVVAEFVGAQPPQQLAAFLDELTGPTPAERVLAAVDGRPEYDEVAEAVRGERVEHALELLLARLDGRDSDRDEVRELMLGLFAELGSDHPTTVHYRRRLASALY